jgi:hypothetical protein
MTGPDDRPSWRVRMRRPGLMRCAASNPRQSANVTAGRGLLANWAAVDQCVCDDEPFGAKNPSAAVFSYSPDRAHPDHLAGYAGIL